MRERREGPDEFPLPKGAADAAEHGLLSRFLLESPDTPYFGTFPPDQTPTGREILDLSPERAAALIRAALPRIGRLENQIADIEARRGNSRSERRVWERAEANRASLAAVIAASFAASCRSG